MTPLQQLIEIIKEKRKQSDISNTMLRFAQVEAEKLLKVEKQNIIEAYKDGVVGAKIAEQYYNDKFKN
jgi:hypothetical protein